MQVQECADAIAGTSLFVVSYAVPDSSKNMDKAIKRIAELVRSELGYKGPTKIFYRDDYETSRGPGWEKDLVQALSQCAVTVAFYSPTYFSDSRQTELCCYCGREIGIFVGREPHQVANVVPVLWHVPSGGVRKMLPDTMVDFTWVLDAEYVDVGLRQRYEKDGLRFLWTKQQEPIRENITLAIAKKIVALHKTPSPAGNEQTTLAATQCVFHPEQRVDKSVSEMARQVGGQEADPGTLTLVYLPDAPLSERQRAQLEQHGRKMGYLVLVCHWAADDPLAGTMMLTKQNGPVVICASPTAFTGAMNHDIRALLASAGWLGGVLLSGHELGSPDVPAGRVTVAARPDDLTDALSQVVANVKRRLMRAGGDDRPGLAGPPLPRL